MKTKLGAKGKSGSTKRPAKAASSRVPYQKPPDYDKIIRESEQIINIENQLEKFKEIQELREEMEKKFEEANKVKNEQFDEV